MHRTGAFACVLFLIGMISSCVGDSPISYKAQFKKDTISISDFVSGLSATKISDGVWFIIDSATLGVYPVPSDSIKISFTAQLIPPSGIVDSLTDDRELLSRVMAG
ncbi:MAG: hypothetical protein QM734_07690 [Cyclobacteriaceae bacterium]